MFDQASPDRATTDGATTDRASLATLIAAQRDGHALEHALYCDPRVFRADLETLFYQEWLFVLSLAELPTPGAFATVQIGDYPVVVVRSQDGAVRAFHNVCRHRGQKLCAEDHGQKRRLVCPYHQWIYDLEGNLIRTRDMGTSFDPTAHSLRPIHTREAGGMVFLCLADTPPAFDDLGASLSRYLAPHALQDTKVAFQSTIVEKGNWKLVIENNRECYHCGGNHPSLCRTFDDRPIITAPGQTERTDGEVARHWARCEAAGLPSEFLIHPTNQWRLARVPLMGDSFTLDGKTAVGKRLGQMPFDDAGSLLFFHYPNSWNHFLADHALTFRVLPISATETQVTTTWLVHKDAVEGVDYDLNRLTEVWLATNDEDRQVVEENQKGILSPAYVPGPYSQVQEDGVIQFIDWYKARMLARLGGDRLALAAE